VLLGGNIDEGDGGISKTQKVARGGSGGGKRKQLGEKKGGLTKGQRNTWGGKHRFNDSGGTG